MAITKNPKLLKLLEASLVDANDAENPFVREGEETYMRYDEIQISQVDGIVAIEYRWLGKTIYTTTIEANLASGQIVLLTGTSGRMLVNLL